MGEEWPRARSVCTLKFYMCFVLAEENAVEGDLFVAMLASGGSISPGIVEIK